MRGNRYVIHTRGRRHEWIFEIVNIDPKFLEEWRADGLIIDELINTIPQWWVDLGLPIRLWCWLQDTLGFD